jgi:transaldolase
VTIELYLDSADFDEVLQWRDTVTGFTSNPTMVAALHRDRTYRDYVREMLKLTQGKSSSFEVLSDDPTTMRYQARQLADLGENVVVKIPAVTSLGEPTYSTIYQLENDDDIRVNQTAVFDPDQADTEATIISLFAGRASYTGASPVLLAEDILANIEEAESKSKLLWAGVRGPYNIYEAMGAGAHIVTVPADSLKRYRDSMGKDLLDFSRETSASFHKDGAKLLW